MQFPFRPPIFLSGHSTGTGDRCPVSLHHWHTPSDRQTPPAPQVPGVNLDEYSDMLVKRFSNPYIKDKVPLSRALGVVAITF